MKNADMPANPCEIAPSRDAISQARACGFNAPVTITYPGLTKREMMAMHALQGLLAAPDLKSVDLDDVSDDAIAYADALLDKLERTCRKT